jgi:hypothetical protein
MNTATEVRRILDAGQADARAEIRKPRNLADADVTAARRERIEVAQERGATRLSRMCEARHIVRTEGVRTETELLAQLQNTLTATVDMPGSRLSRYRSMLSDLAVAIEDDMTGEEPWELPS